MKNYDNFFLPVDDLVRGREFYEKALGLSVKFDFSTQGMIAFKIGNEESAIILKDLRKFVNVKPTIWFEVENVKKTYKELKNKGVVFLSEPLKSAQGLLWSLKTHLETDWGLQIIPRCRGYQRERDCDAI